MEPGGDNDSLSGFQLPNRYHRANTCLILKCLFWRPDAPFHSGLALFLAFFLLFLAFFLPVKVQRKTNKRRERRKKNKPKNSRLKKKNSRPNDAVFWLVDTHICIVIFIFVIHQLPTICQYVMNKWFAKELPSLDRNKSYTASHKYLHASPNFDRP